jgi:glucans biosynthesis protein
VVGQPRKYFSWRFAVDFAGPNLAKLGPNAKVEAVITASRGQLEITSARPLESINGWRAMFDLRPDESTAPITIRLFLRSGREAITETWLYQWVPPAVAERRLY